MRTIGLLGGMSWESTQIYYQEVNQATKKQLGGHHSAKIAMVSVDFAEIESCQRSGDWDKTADLLGEAAQQVEQAGADFFLICTNTMHKVAPQVQQYVTIPLLHIADVTVDALKRDQVSKVALLGTAFTMEESFYKDKLSEEHGIEVIIPNGVQRKLVHDIIYNELTHGEIKATSKDDFYTLIADLKERGAEAVILGCTEIGLLVEEVYSALPIYDTARLHAHAAVKLANS